MNNCVRSEWIDATAARAARDAGGAGAAAAWRGAPRRASLVPVVGSAAERLREPSPPRRRSLVVVVRRPASPAPPASEPMETQNQDVARSPAEVPNDPGYVRSPEKPARRALFRVLLVLFILQEDVRRRPQLAD